MAIKKVAPLLAGEEKLKAELLLRPLNSVDELIDWVHLYFDIKLPKGHVYPSSNASPAEAAWRIYELYKTGKSKEIPVITMCASRDSFKTLTASIIEVLCFIHFKFSMVHGAAIKEQSQKSFEYCSGFFRKIQPYLEANGWKKTTDSKTKIEYITNDGDLVYLTIVAVTKQSMNGHHTPLLVLDEIDLMRQDGYDESKMIPSTYKKYFPLTVYLSTRKYAGGLMEKTIQMTEKIGEVLKWNIVDITEKMDDSVLQREKPLVPRYLSIKPPLINISEEEYNKIPEEKRSHLERFEAYAGIAEHQLLPVMRHFTADRPDDNKGYLYKPTIAVLNNFRSLDPAMADAQLLCNKPSGTNLVYSRFHEVENVLNLEDAFVRLGRPHETNKSHEMLKWLLKDLGVLMIGGADFGWTDATSMVVLAVFPNGEVWLVDTFVQVNMEIPDIVMKCKEFDVQWDVARWYTDTAYPAYMKELRKAGLKVPDFKKVVSDGLSAVQMKILDGKAERKFQVLDIPQNKQVIEAFAMYKWDTDSQGEIIDGQPFHGKDGVSDIMDSIRYPFQNLFAKGGMQPIVETTALTTRTKEKSAQEINAELIYGPYKQYFTQNSGDSTQKKKKKIMF